MRFEHEGMSIWYGTADAPAPGELVPAGADVPITIGIQPADASNRPEVLYRVNRGEQQQVDAKWLRNDASKKTQYFEARLGPFRASDLVEYTVRCGCAGRNVPSPDEARDVTSVFRVVEDGARGSEFGAERATSIRAVGTAAGRSELRFEPLGVRPMSEAPPQPARPAWTTPVGANPAVAGAETDQHRVEGRILFEHGLPASGVTLRLYNRGFGGTAARLGEITTDDKGSYVLPYDPGSTAANLEIRAVDSQGMEILLSDTKFNADKHEVLNLVAPASVKPATPEFQWLSTDLGNQLGNLNKLAEAQEGGVRQDLTLLHQATGWDARLIALAATAVKGSAETGIPQNALYALFRSGLPTNTEQLAWIDSQTVETALGKAKEAGIASFNDQQITMAKAAFETFSRTTRLAAKAPGAVSSFGDLMSKSGSSPAERLNAAEQDTFADLYFAHRGTGVELWQKAREKGISEEKINGLRLQGKLAYLTLNNADLAVSLQQEIGSPADVSKLVDADLFQADAWKGRLNAIAGNDEALQKLIPPAYITDKTDAKENLEERLDAYSEDLARKVRLSFPTQVVRRMIENGPEKGGLSLGEHHDVLKTPVQSFLKNAEPLGFDLGQTPVEAFVERNRENLFQGIAEDQVTDTTEGVKTLQRLYQTTPSDESLKILLKEGFKSAHDIVAFPYLTFLDRYGRLFPSREEAQIVYRKAEQITVVTRNFFTIAKQLDSAPPVAVMSPPAHIRETAKNELIKHYPTMESLFGSLDFCECEHCRSVLSPAAYFVDLLQFLDPDELVWKNFLNVWLEKHNGKAYDGPDYKYKKPYDALIERRPDLPHLALTCENTQTALPYIDIVNEILEYYVANDKLAQNAVRDTGDATSAELLAEPQNVIPKAYEAVNSARYPLTLPFDLWLETARRFSDYFETPLWQVLETFRPSDQLFTPAADPKPYNRADIFSEYLGFSPAEYGIFVDPNPLGKWFELYGYSTEGEGLGELKSAKTLSRRLGVSYKDLTEIVQTSFVNPELDGLSIIWRLHLAVGNIVQYFKEKDKPEYAEEKKAFENRLASLIEETSSHLKPDDILVKLTNLTEKFQSALVLRDTSPLCSFDQTYLEYADFTDPSKRFPDALVFLKINFFVRLWKKLGWTMEETDRALRAFLPKNLLPLMGANLGAALKTALVYLAHLKSLDDGLKVGKNSRLKLLILWSNLSTTGKNPLYSQLFLTRSILKNDPVFDDPLANYLATAGILVKDHLLAIQAALNLTADEIGQILTDAGKNPDTVELSLDTVSLLYRYGMLAKALRLSVGDLVVMKDLSGLDPFKSLSADPLTTLEDDHPFGQTLRFVEMVEKVKESGFKIADLDYLFRHRFDPIGNHRSSAEAPLALVKSLAAEIRRIQLEHAIPADPLALTDDLLRQKMALALPPDVVENFLSVWTGRVVYEVEVDAQPANKLDPGAFAEEPAIRISYDEVRQKQRLSYRGVLLDAEKQRLKAAHTPPVFAALLDRAQEEARPFKEFFKNKLQKYQVNESRTGGFLDSSDFDLLFAPIPPIPDGLSEAEKQARRQANEDSMRQKRKKLAEVFLPFLQKALIRQLVVQTLATGLNADHADPALTEALLTETDMLSDPRQTGRPLLDAFSSAGERGINAEFFASADMTGEPLIRTTIPSAETGEKDDKKHPIRPSSAQSARFKGYFEVPSAGAYRLFMVFAKKDAKAELRLSTLPETILTHTATKDDDEISGPGDFVELKAGVPYQFTFDINNLAGGDVALLIQGENLPKDFLGRLTLYPESAIERVHHAQLLLAKTLQLIQGLGLSEREVRYLLTHKADFDNLDLSQLPSSETPASPTSATALFGQFLRLAEYALLKRNLAGGTDDIITIFENARRAAPEPVTDLCKRMAALTRRKVAVVQATATHLGMSTVDFAQERGIQRLWEALELLDKLGVPVEALIGWTAIVSKAKTPEERFAIARDLKNTIKARYESENWQRIAQSIFDKLRQRQRDALVAYILDRHGFERMEQLFEYFLIDPGMEPVVQTSRIRLAISSVQLFIQRCLLNLEPQVHPSVINSKQWQWVKRYRVWEANRKIFLFPENWLEPEFRDDKTHIFQELEGALLQGDVSNDLAEDAFFNYLKKLKELAQLDIVAMYCEEKPDPALNTLHVIGRTSPSPHKYFYRRYAHQMWTPWEPVGAEIDGDHIVAVVWRERLHLFWLTFLPKPQPDSTPKQVDKNASVGEIFNAGTQATPQLEVQVQLNWSECFQGQWSTRTSSGFINLTPGATVSSFDSQAVFIYVSKEYEDGEEQAVKVNLSGAINRSFKLVSKHSPPESDNASLIADQPYAGSSRQVTWYQGPKDGGALRVNFVKQIKKEDDKFPEFTPETKDILRRGGGYSLVACNNLFSVDFNQLKSVPEKEIEEAYFQLLVKTLDRTIISPFFYQDSQHRFFVEPTLTETTIDRWEEWVITPPIPGVKFDEHWWKSIPMVPLVPTPKTLLPMAPIDPRARFGVQPKIDWLTDPNTVLQFGGRVIGQTGALSATLVSAATRSYGLDTSVDIRSGALNPGAVAISPGSDFDVGVVAHSGMNVIGGGGLNSALAGNINASGRSSLGRELTGIGPVRGTGNR